MDIKISPYELVTEMERYKPFVYDLMNFLNPHIAPMNPCNVFIDVYNPTNYAEYRKPNIINVYLGSVINNFYKNSPGLIMSVLSVCITHELYHASQDIDTLKYSHDKDYCDLIERQAEYMAEQFVLLNAEIFKVKFGFNPRDYIRSYTKRPEVPYKNFQLRDFYINAISAVVIRNEDGRQTLEKWFDRRDEISNQFYIHFSDLDEEMEWYILIRNGEEYLEQSVPEFCRALNYLYRRGTANMRFKVECALTEDGIRITTRNKTYNPVDFF